MPQSEHYASRPYRGPNQDYLRFLFVRVRNTVKEARHGAVLGDMSMIIEVLNTLDLMVDEAGTRLGLPAPVPSAIGVAQAPRAPEQGRIYLRLEPPVPEMRTHPKRQPLRKVRPDIKS